MKGRINFVLPLWMKRELDDLARKVAVKEGRAISNGELIRRAIKAHYKLCSKKNPSS